MTQSALMKQLENDFTDAIKSILIDLSDELINELFNKEVDGANLVAKCIHQACDEILILRAGDDIKKKDSE